MAGWFWRRTTIPREKSVSAPLIAVRQYRAHAEGAQTQTHTHTMGG